MKFRNHRIALFVGLAGMLSAATALAAGWSQLGTISQVNLDSTTAGNGTLTYLTFATAPTGRPSACNTDPAVVASGSADHVKAMTSLATAAWLAGKTVKVYFDGSCTGNYAKFVNIIVQ